jgi:hypothetical protein
VLRTLKSVLKHWQAAQKTERKSESESEIAMCDRMQMYNITSKAFTCMKAIPSSRGYNSSTARVTSSFYKIRTFTAARRHSAAWSYPGPHTSSLHIHSNLFKTSLKVSFHILLSLPYSLFTFSLCTKLNSVDSFASELWVRYGKVRCGNGVRATGRRGP